MPSQLEPVGFSGNGDDRESEQSSGKSGVDSRGERENRVVFLSDY